MKIKYNLPIVAFALIIIFIGCEKEYEVPNQFSSVGWYTTGFRSQTMQIGINNFMSFSDLSHNVLTHTWTISEGSYFLEGPINRQDLVLTDFIIQEAGLEISDKTINVLFTKGGIQPVRLYNTFSEPVSFLGNDTIYAKQEGNIWVIDTTFMVDVYDTIVPQILIKQNGVQIPTGADTIYVEAGETLEFVDITTIGRPNTWNWQVSGESSGDSSAVILFKKLGVFQAVLNISRQGNNIPADYERHVIPNPIKVIASTKPWELSGDIIELSDETIQIPFNGEFMTFLNKNDYFKVTVNDVEFAISSITINSNDATLLDIKLVEPIYRPDVITVSLLDGSGIQSTDYRTLTPFTDIPVIMDNQNLWDDTIYGFEDGGDSWISTDTGTVEYSTEHPASGQYCLKLIAGTDFTRASSQNFPVSLDAGKTYTVTYKVWIDPSTTTSDFGPWFYWSGGSQQFWQATGGKPRGEWITISRDQTITGTGPAYMTFRVKNAILYFDDVHIVEKEERPL